MTEAEKWAGEEVEKRLERVSTCDPARIRPGGGPLLLLLGRWWVPAHTAAGGVYF
jgi:hypothetical protein